LEGDEEEDVTDEEIATQKWKMKKKKASGMNRIENEAWLYSGGKS